MGKRNSGFRMVPHPRLVPHEIRFRLPLATSSSTPQLEAIIHCERRDCTLSLNECRSCPRFARIDVHEAGYTMLCRSTDEDLAPEGVDQEDGSDQAEDELAK